MMGVRFYGVNSRSTEPLLISLECEGSSASLYSNVEGEKVLVSGKNVSALLVESDRVYGSSHFDLAKVDIEGAEHEISDSEMTVLARHVRYLIIEVHPNNRSVVDKFSERLRQIGFIEHSRGGAPDDNVCVFKSAHC